MNRGLVDVFSELLTYRRGNQFYRIRLPEAWQGTAFIDVMVDLKRDDTLAVILTTRSGLAGCAASSPCEFSQFL